MLDKILGTKTAELIMLQLFHKGEVYARELARDSGLSLSAIQNQLQKFEETGVIHSQRVGNVRLYRFNSGSPLTKPLTELIKVAHSGLSLSDKEFLFGQRKERKDPQKKSNNSFARYNRR
jgi:DNA-binding transcriptional ArsR family regulator